MHIYVVCIVSGQSVWRWHQHARTARGRCCVERCAETVACAQVRPLNNRERDEGLRSCVTFDEPSRQVVLQVS